MLCFLTARRLKPESYDRFRQVWEPDEWPAGFLRAYHLRNPQDEDQVISFGLFEGTMDDYRALRADQAASQVEDRRQREMAEVVMQLHQREQAHHFGFGGHQVHQ